MRREKIRFTLTAETGVSTLNPGRIPIELREAFVEWLSAGFNEWLRTCYEIQQEGAELIGDMEHVLQPRDDADVMIRVTNDFTVDGVFIKIEDDDVALRHTVRDNRPIRGDMN